MADYKTKQNKVVEGLYNACKVIQDISVPDSVIWEADTQS